MLRFYSIIRNLPLWIYIDLLSKGERNLILNVNATSPEFDHRVSGVLKFALLYCSNKEERIFRCWPEKFGPINLGDSILCTYRGSNSVPWTAVHWILLIIQIPVSDDETAICDSTNFSQPRIERSIHINIGLILNDVYRFVWQLNVDKKRTMDLKQWIIEIKYVQLHLNIKHCVPAAAILQSSNLRFI